MKLKLLLFFLIFATPALSTYLVPAISFVIHQDDTKSNRSYVIHVTNISDEPKSFTRIELNNIDGIAVKDYRENILCDCGEECTPKQQFIKPNTTIDFIWDGKSQSCENAPAGKYLAQLVDKCDAEGCLGTYWPSIGGHFDVNVE